MRPAARRDEGVSTVLGAILMFALLVITLVTIQVHWVPRWEHDREADHMQEVQTQLSQVKSDLDRLADNRTNVPITDPLATGTARGFVFFSSANVPGSVGFSPAATGQGVAIASPQVHLQQLNGERFFAGSESWTQLLTGGTVTNIGDVQNLRIRIYSATLTACQGSGTQGKLGTVQLTLTDSHAAYAGKFEVALYREQGQSCSFKYSTYAATSSTTPITIYTETFFWHPSSDPAPQYEYVDTLRSEFSFRDVISQAAAPFSISEAVLAGDVTPSPQADYTIGYDLVTSGGTVQVGGGGIVVPNFSQVFQGGALAYHAPNQRYPEQTYILEHGGLIVAQPAEGEAMMVAPEFRVQLVAGQTSISWTVPAMTGSATTVSGASHASIAMAPSGPRTNLVATMGRVSFTLTTSHTAAWSQYFTGALQQAGLSSAGGTPQFTVTTGASTVTVAIFGIVTDPNSTVDDITLNLKGGNVATSALAIAGG